MFFVYLAGPMVGLTIEEAMSWRREAMSRLSSPSIHCLSPVRGVGKETVPGSFPTDPLATPLTTDRAITTRDRADIKRADVVMMNLCSGGSVSIGTIIELGWADAFRVPVVGINGGRLHSLYNHPFVRDLVSFWCPNVAEAAFCVLSILDID